MALGTIHVLAEGRASTTLVMCPSHITHKWAREALLTVPRARTFLIEDMRNGGDPKRPHGICEVKLRQGKIVYEGLRLSLAQLRHMGRKEWRRRCPASAFFITGKDRGKLGYYWENVYLKAKSGPNLGGIINPDTGTAIMDSERQKLTYLDNGLGVLGRAAKRLIALTGTLMGGYADDLFNIFYRMEPHAMTRKTIQVLKKPGAFAASICQVPDEHDGVSVTGRHRGQSAALRRERAFRCDG